MENRYRHLGTFGDWVEMAHEQRVLRPAAPPGPETRALVQDTLGFCNAKEEPTDSRVEDSWERDGIAGEEVSWSVGYGPRTRGWVMKPAGARGPFPGVLALHCHGGVKYFGKEKIADGPKDPDPLISDLRTEMYSGRAYANELAREGFLVLAHDVFMWGSRRFPLEEMPETVQKLGASTQDPVAVSGDVPGERPPEAALYDAAAHHHEHLAEKYCRLLGTTLAGVVAFEDRVATNYLLSRSDVAPKRAGCVGLSGGGCRAALLQATCDHVAAAVVVGMMSTHESLLDGRVEPHTWMFFPGGWARHGDWPDLAACRAPSPLMVQYDREDHLFSMYGMVAAHERISSHYRKAGHPAAYEGQFYDGPHKFDLRMQQEAFAWLTEQLAT